MLHLQSYLALEIQGFFSFKTKMVHGATTTKYRFNIPTLTSFFDKTNANKNVVAYS